MKKIIQFFKNRSDKKLRERCVDYATRNQGFGALDDAIFQYEFIKNLPFGTINTALNPPKKTKTAVPDKQSAPGT